MTGQRPSRLDSLCRRSAESVSPEIARRFAIRSLAHSIPCHATGAHAVRSSIQRNAQVVVHRAHWLLGGRGGSARDHHAPLRTRVDPAHVEPAVADWGKLLGDNAAVSAMLDRLLHHAHLLKAQPSQRTGRVPPSAAHCTAVPSDESVTNTLSSVVCAPAAQ